MPFLTLNSPCSICKVYLNETNGRTFLLSSFQFVPFFSFGVKIIANLTLQVI